MHQKAQCHEVKGDVYVTMSSLLLFMTPKCLSILESVDTIIAGLCIKLRRRTELVSYVLSRIILNRTHHAQRPLSLPSKLLMLQSMLY